LAAWDETTFNYSWCLALGVILFSIVLYPLLGKGYTGPNIQALEHFRQEVIQGLAPTRSAQEEHHVQVVKGPSVRTSDETSK
jgi:hypothetical protein